MPVSSIYLLEKALSNAATICTVFSMMKPVTRLKSTMMGILASESFLEFRRKKSRLFDKRRIETPAVHYFHQVDDPYSFLTVQKLNELQRRYNISFVPHLVGAPTTDFMGDETRYEACSLTDARSIAEHYGVLPPTNSVIPDRQQVDLANRVLSAALKSGDYGEFAASAMVVGENMWRNHNSVENVAFQSSSIDLVEGEALRTKLGHYFGAMFYYDGEWFWGLDRLHLLEQRLSDTGYSSSPVQWSLRTSTCCCTRNRIASRRCDTRVFPIFTQPLHSNWA